MTKFKSRQIGEILINIQAMVIETGARRIMVDPCIGNDMDRGFTPVSMLDFCRDEAQAAATRRSIPGRAAGTPTLLLGTHFADPTGVRVTADRAGWRVRETG